MTPLRQRMLEDMQLRGLSARTQGCYVAAVRQLAEHYQTSPASLTDDQLRQYFLYLTNDKKVARTTATIALCATRFLYEQTLHQPWPTLRFVRPAPSTRLPTVLSRDEVRQILGLVRIRVYRECLTTIYAGGLRLLEGARIQIADIDSGRNAAPHSRQGGPRPLCAAARAAPPAPARLLAYPSVARVALPGSHASRAPAQPRAPGRARHAQQSAKCVSSRVAEERDGQTGQRAHAATFVRDPPP